MSQGGRLVLSDDTEKICSLSAGSQRYAHHTDKTRYLSRPARLMITVCLFVCLSKKNKNKHFYVWQGKNCASRCAHGRIERKKVSLCIVEEQEWRGVWRCSGGIEQRDWISMFKERCWLPALADSFSWETAALGDPSFTLTLKTLFSCIHFKHGWCRHRRRMYAQLLFPSGWKPESAN